MSRSRLAGALLTLVALPAALAADDSPAAPAPLRFGWPVPSEARVTESLQKSGHSATIRYTAAVALSGSGPDLRLHLSDYEIVDIDGHPGTDPALAQQVQLTLMGLRVTPDLLIGPGGDVKDVIGLDVAVETMLAELSKNADEAQKQNLPRLRAQFASPAAQAAMKDNAKKAWTSWVGEWVGRVIPEGRGADGSYPVACPTGARVAAPTRLRRMSGESEGAGLVKFTRESVLDGEDARPVLDAFVKQLAAAGRAIPATGMRIVDLALTVADPATLRPRRVLHEEQRTLRLEDLPERTDVERHEYTFEWETSGK